MILRDIGFGDVDWFKSAWYTDQLWVLVNSLTDRSVTEKGGNLVTS
jgi:hypothetical protein